jgi:hypothetical protein
MAANELGCNGGGWYINHCRDLQPSVEDGTMFLPIMVHFNSLTRTSCGDQDETSTTRYKGRISNDHNVSNANFCKSISICALSSRSQHGWVVPVNSM